MSTPSQLCPLHVSRSGLGHKVRSQNCPGSIHGTTSCRIITCTLLVIYCRPHGVVNARRIIAALELLPCMLRIQQLVRFVES
jgi:hypothetical protein